MPSTTVAAGPLARLLGLRQLLWQLIRRDIAGRYRGSFGGLAWSLITPVLLLGVYLFVFGYVFNPRHAAGAAAGGPGAGIVQFGLSLFCGVLVHGMFAECLVRSPGVIVGQPSYVKKIVFPLELLPLVTVGSAMFHLVVGLAVLLLGVLVLHAAPGPYALLVPLALVPLVLMSAGVAWLTASLGVYLRDIGQLTGLAATMLMFLSPVFYPVEALPAQWRWLALASPLTVPIETLRDTLLHRRMPDMASLAAYWAVALVVFALGWLWFAKTRRGFADVL
jgi:lipopolysaccharide transport system permease protein